MKKTIKDFNLENKRVIIRVDFNVPIKDGVIQDDTRIKESLETINYVINNKGKVILLSHLGRVKEEKDKTKYTLSPIVERLSYLLNKPVTFISDLDFENIKKDMEYVKDKDIILLENTRFYDLDNKLESNNSKVLATFYASLGDIFINDAFGTIHRSHASNAGIASILPSGIGFLVEKELNKLSYLNNPLRPYIVILGGSKVSDKIGVIEELVKKCDLLIIGGAMANTFLKAKGIDIGKSLVEDDYIDFCIDILNKYEDKIILPIDTKVSDDMILDLGDNTISLIKDKLRDAKTVFWNGPLGFYEVETYMKATKEILTFLVEKNIKTILGGGDIVAASSMLNLKEKVYHASTGGGATLEYLEGKELPGLKTIQDKE